MAQPFFQKRLEKIYKGMIVNVKFIFDSPSSGKKIIGFVTPDKNESYNWNGELNISDFKTAVNGKTVKSNVEEMGKFLKKGILSKVILKPYTGEKYKDSYVYYFNADFKKGENTVEHSYIYSGSGGTAGNDYDYVITAISKWKNKKPVNWEIVGEGKIAVIDEKIVEKKEAVKEKVYVKVKSGYVRYKTENFVPDEEIRIYNNRMYEIYSRFSESTVGKYKLKDDLLDKIGSLLIYELTEDNINLLKSLTDKELEIARNYPYAIAGYDFERKDLKEYFNQFVWYIPIGKNVEIDKNSYLRQEVNKILKERKNIKNKDKN